MDVAWWGGRFRLAVSKKLEDQPLCCDDEARRSVFVFVGHFFFAFRPSSTSIKPALSISWRAGFKPRGTAAP